jgi:hypothetical protein
MPPPTPKPNLKPEQVYRIASRNPKIASWLSRYHNVTHSVVSDDTGQTWTVHFYGLNPGKVTKDEIAQAVVQDSTGKVTEAWTGPQVAWRMARGYDGAFGRKINDPWIWGLLCALFLAGLADLRRPISLRNLDLVVLLSFTVSLGFFNQGLIFWSMPLAYPPLVYLLVRLGWLGFRGARRPAWTGSLPIWVLAGAAVFLIGFRGGLNAYNSGVIDVGYAGVIGADRLVRGDIPYGTMPTNQGAPCGIKYSDGTNSAYRQVHDGNRCESPNPTGDTYGPINYAAYIPAVTITGWTGLWDDLPAAHLTSFVFDALCFLGLVFAGRRLGGWPLGAVLAFAWAAYPFTAYALSSNSNDMVVTAFLVWGFVALTSPAGRGLLISLAAWTKFAPLLAWPLWARYPRERELAPTAEWVYDADGEQAVAPPPSQRRRHLLRAGLGRLGPTDRLVAYTLGILGGTGLAALLLAGGGSDAPHAFWHATFGYQLDRQSPFSLWDWGVLYQGFVNLQPVQTALKLLLVLFALLLFFLPRRLDAVRLAALTGALLVGFEITLSHWFYLYIPWFFPFAIIAFCAPSRRE